MEPENESSNPSAQNPSAHPLEHDYEDESSLKRLDREAPTEKTTVRRSRIAQLWIRWSLRALVTGAIIAFLAGVAAANSVPQSPGEIGFSVVNRAGILLMLASCVAMLIGYRWDQLRSISLPKHRPKSHWGNLLIFNALFLVSAVVLQFIAAATLHRYSLILCVGISMLQCALAVTMVVVQKGIWRCYGVGVAVIQVLNMTSGIQTSFASAYVYSAISLGGLSRGMPNWLGVSELLPIMGIQIFACVTGLLCAGYYALFVDGSDRENE